MTSFGRQASLNNRRFETLARAIAHKHPSDVLAIISFEDDPISREPRPDDLLHEEIEKLRASPEYTAYLARHPEDKREITESEAEKFIRDMGREASVVVHANGLVRATAIYGDLSQIQRIQNEVDNLLEQIQRSHRIVKKS